MMMSKAPKDADLSVKSFGGMVSNAGAQNLPEGACILNRNGDLTMREAWCPRRGLANACVAPFAAAIDSIGFADGGLGSMVLMQVGAVLYADLIDTDHVHRAWGTEHKRRHFPFDHDAT
jgi:hypothetical protein